MALNLWSDVSSISNSIQEDAIFIVREAGKMQSLVTVYRDATGMNPCIGHKYNAGTAQTIAETDDLTSKAFTPSADQTLTPDASLAQAFDQTQTTPTKFLIEPQGRIVRVYVGGTDFEDLGRRIEGMLGG